MQIFLGAPSSTIQETFFFRQLRKNLENFTNCSFDTETKLLRIIQKNILPKVGSTFMVNYQMDQDNPDKYIDLELRILGYNATIPQFIKYKSGNNFVYIPSIPENSHLLTPIAANTKVYSYPNFYRYGGKTVSQVSEDTFTYGQTNSDWGITATENGEWSVPMQVTLNDGLTYTFAGYNVTVIPIAAPIGLKNGVSAQAIAFNPLPDGVNVWSSSNLRLWGNTNGLNDDTYFYCVGTKKGLIDGLLGRFKQSFMVAVTPVVNRTWVREACREGLILDANYCEHVIDTFWAPSAAQMNTPKSVDDDKEFEDFKYDTARFTTVFSDNSSRTTKKMNEDGTVDTGKTRNYSLRSAVGFTKSTSAGGTYYGRGFISGDSATSGAGVANVGALTASVAAQYACTIG